MASHSVPASEPLISQSRLPFPRTAPSRQSKTTPKPLADSNSASRKPKSSKMSYASMQDPSTASWIASLRDGRASRTPSPASAAGLPTNDGSGTTLPASCASAAPRSSSVRTSPESCGTPVALLTRMESWMSPQMTLLGEWEPFCGIWPRWGALWHGEVYELPKWEPATGGRECSWWPTTTTKDSNSSGRHSTTTGVMHPGTTLNDAIATWATPTRMDSEQAGGTGNYRGKSLHLQTSNWPRLWPTTSARDWKSGEAIADYGNARPLSEAVLDFSSRPVPRTRDGLTFCSRVRILRRLCRRLRRRLPSPYRRARSIFRTKLNPDFTDWLMGWPVGWSSEDRVFSAAEMESYLSRERRYLRFLLGN
jgi:hypothetical protein